jgi:hypothetical protein
MRFLCDAPGGKSWFVIETEGEAALESDLMQHAVEKFFCRERERATQSYRPPAAAHFEQEIGLKAHLRREMAMFLTLRDAEGKALATAMLPPPGRHDHSFRPIVVGLKNADPYPEHGAAILALARHLDIELERSRCYPYRRD